MRIKTLQLAIACIFIFLSFALFYFQIIQRNQYRQLSKNNCIRLIPQEGIRGRILDRNGNVIVENRLIFNVLFFPQQNSDIEKTLTNLAAILKMSIEDIKSRFKEASTSFLTPVTLAENIDKQTAIIIEELKSDLSGIIIQPSPKRYYPYGRLASHILGYLGEIDPWRLTKLKNYGYKSKDIVGYGGIEERYDYYLKTKEGGLQVEVDNRGRITRVIGLRPPKNGKDIQLTIDLRIQKIIEEAIADKKGAIIVLDPYSGEVLAMASFPNFNPGLFLKKSYSKETILRDLDAPLLNRSISGLYPAGSVFKIVVATAGLESEKISSSTTFFCPGGINLGKQEYSCWDTHGNQNLVSAITHSCNVFFYSLGLLMGPDKIYDYAIKFGLGSPTQIDLPSELSGFVPNPLWKKLTKFKGWFPGDTANFSIGQGDLLVTPLQITRLVASFANGGYLIWPHLIKAIDGRGAHSYKKTIPLFLKTETLKPIKLGLEKTVMDSDGTASILAIPGLSISGKTGTAQVPHRQPHAWFVGFFPTEKPKFTICVFLEHSGPSYNACIVAKKVIEAMKTEGLL